MLHKRPKEYRCAVCDCLFLPGERQCYSGLFGSNHLLHKECRKQEDEWTEEHGNDAPHILKTYINRLDF